VNCQISADVSARGVNTLHYGGPACRAAYVAPKRRCGFGRSNASRRLTICWRTPRIEAGGFCFLQFQFPPSVMTGRSGRSVWRPQLRLLFSGFIGADSSHEKLAPPSVAMPRMLRASTTLFHKTGRFRRRLPSNAIDGARPGSRFDPLST